MLSNHAGKLYRAQLTASNSNENPSVNQNSSVKFGFENLPAVVATRTGIKGLAVFGIRLLIGCSVVQSGGTGTKIYYDQLVKAIVSKISIQGAWHGSPISSDYWTGKVLPWVSYVFNGYRWPFRAIEAIPAANGTYDIAIPIWIPLSIGLGSKAHHTAQQACMFKNAVLEVFTSASSVLTAMSTGASVSSIDMKATVYALKTDELILGPAVEYSHYTVAMSANTNLLLKFLNFAQDTALRGVAQKSGLIWACLYDTTFDSDCDFVGPNIRRVGVPFLDQPEISDPMSFLDEAVDAQGPTRVNGGVIAQAAGTDSDYSGYPYLMGTRSSQGGSENPLADSAEGMIGLPLVSPPYDLELSKLQIAGGTENVTVTMSAAPTAGHVAKIGCIAAKAWTKEARAAWREYLIKEGVAEAVLGRAPAEAYQFAPKLKNKQSPDRIQDVTKFAWLPEKLVNKAKPLRAG